MIVKDAQEQGIPPSTLIRKLGNFCLNTNEIGSHEMVDTCLGIPFSIDSSEYVSITTAPEEERMRVLKSKKDLSELPTDSEDVFKPSQFDKYKRRNQSCPQLLSACMADVLCLYNFKGWKMSSEDKVRTAEFDPKKGNRRILMTNPVREDVDPQGFYGQHLLLYVPW